MPKKKTANATIEGIQVQTPKDFRGNHTPISPYQRKYGSLKDVPKDESGAIIFRPAGRTKQKPRPGEKGNARRSSPPGPKATIIGDEMATGPRRQIETTYFKRVSLVTLIRKTWEKKYFSKEVLVVKFRPGAQQQGAARP